jgi:hypothetical protein
MGAKGLAAVPSNGSGPNKSTAEIAESRDFNEHTASNSSSYPLPFFQKLQIKLGLLGFSIQVHHDSDIHSNNTEKARANRDTCDVKTQKQMYVD